MEQKTYSCLLTLFSPHAPGRLAINKIPMDPVTAQEMELLAFMHGNDAVDAVKVVGMHEFRDEHGEPVVNTFPMDEYKRLAKKYDRATELSDMKSAGRVSVEQCFKVRLDGFERLQSEITAAETAAQKIAAAEEQAAQATSSATTSAREATEKAGEGGKSMGSLVASMFDKKQE